MILLNRSRRPEAVTGQCYRHQFEHASTRCVGCGQAICAECVVPLPRTTLCIPCALERSGVRVAGRDRRH